MVNWKSLTLVNSKEVQNSIFLKCIFSWLPVLTSENIFSNREREARSKKFWKREREARSVLFRKREREREARSVLFQKREREARSVLFRKREREVKIRELFSEVNPRSRSRFNHCFQVLFNSFNLKNRLEKEVVFENFHHFLPFFCLAFDHVLCTIYWSSIH